MVVSFIGGGNPRTRRKPPTCRKSRTNFITKCCIEYTSSELDSNSYLLSYQCVKCSSQLSELYTIKWPIQTYQPAIYVIRKVWKYQRGNQKP